MYSPIEQLLILNGGEEAVLMTPFVGGSADYDPASNTDFAPGNPQKKPLRCIWSDVYDEQLQAGETGTVLIAARSLPEGAVPERSKLLLNGVTYDITRIRRRVHMGKTDGFQLFLAA